MPHIPFRVGQTIERVKGNNGRGHTFPGYIGVLKEIRGPDDFVELHFEDGAWGNYWEHQPAQWVLREIEPNPPRPFRVGDRVRFIDDKNPGWWFKTGDIGTIERIEKGGAWPFRVRFDRRNGVQGAVGAGMLELIEGENNMPIDYVVGDKVQRNADAGNWAGVKPGDIVTVKDIGGEGAGGPIWITVKEHEGMFSPRAFTKVEEKVQAPAFAKPTKFIFASKGGKYYGKAEYANLNDARTHTTNLRRRYGTADIYEYIMVEDV